MYRMNYEEIELDMRCREALKEVQKNNAKIELKEHELKQKKMQDSMQQLELKSHNSTKLNSPEEMREPDPTDYSIFKHQAIKDVEFLMKTNSQIFNVTPPNAKADGKFKNAESSKTEASSSKITELAKIDPFGSNWIF